MKNITIIIAIVLITIGIIPQLQAQDNTMYFTKNIAQRIELNPAFQNDCKFFVGLPVISSVKYSFDNTGFGYNDIIKQGTGDMADSLIIDLANLPNVLGKINFLSNTLDIAILSVGVKHQDFYFSLGISNHTEFRIGYPRDLINVKDGNWDLENDTPRPLDFSGIGVDFMNYTTIGLGVSRRMNESLSLGFRAKYLMGSMNLNTRKSNLLIETEKNPIAVTGEADVEINATFPMDLTYNEDGLVEEISIGEIDPVKDFLHNKNKGVAFDLGMVYQPNDELEIAVSVVDLGMIKWTHNATNFTAKSTFRFIGFDFEEYTQMGDTVQLFEDLLDSVRNSLALSDTKEAYSTLLTPKVFVGATYSPFDMLDIGALGKVMYYNNRIDPSVTLMANVRPLNFLSLSASWSYMNRTYRNIGFALAIGNKGAQFYLAADNIPVKYVKDVNSGIMWPLQARTFNFRFGLNILFGCGDGDSNEKGNKKGGSKYCPAY